MTNLLPKKWIALGLCLMICMAPAKAMIVHDPKNTLELVKQIREMEKQYSMLVQQYKAVSGKNRIAKAFKKNYTKLWNWQDNYQEQASRTDTKKYEKLSDHNKYAKYSDKHTKVSMAMADSVYETVGKEQKLINKMLNDSAGRETLKESMDQNSALLVKLAQLQMEVIRMQSQQLRLQAISQQKENVIENWQQNFFKEKVK